METDGSLTNSAGVIGSETGSEGTVAVIGDATWENGDYLIVAAAALQG
ncbi:hypothetical protein FVA81_07925 [Rhizobium sp. WL3]|nr:hypothetical protein FVA81_07925 [Rhizobium sp. WL3]